MREERDEVEQAAEGRAVDLHRAVLGAEGDAVLVIVDVGRILQKPVLPREFDRDDAVVFARRIVGAPGAGVALRLAAELALRVARGFGAAGRGDRARILLRLGEVDRDVELAVLRRGLPLAVLRDAVAADVVRVAGEAVIPVGRRLRFRVEERAEGPDHGRGPRREHAHETRVHQVAAGDPAVDEAARGRVVEDGFQDRLKVLARFFPRGLEAVQAEDVQQAVARPDLVAGVDQAFFQSVAEQRVDFIADHVFSPSDDSLLEDYTIAFRNFATGRRFSFACIFPALVIECFP